MPRFKRSRVSCVLRLRPIKTNRPEASPPHRRGAGVGVGATGAGRLGAGSSTSEKDIVVVPKLSKTTCSWCLHGQIRMSPIVFQGVGLSKQGMQLEKWLVDEPLVSNDGWVAAAVTAAKHP